MELPHIGQVARLVSIELRFVLSLGETAEENNKRCVQKESDFIDTQNCKTHTDTKGREAGEGDKLQRLINYLLRTQHLRNIRNMARHSTCRNIG